MIDDMIEKIEKLYSEAFSQLSTALEDSENPIDDGTAIINKLTQVDQ